MVPAASPTHDATPTHDASLTHDASPTHDADVSGDADMSMSPPERQQQLVDAMEVDDDGPLGNSEKRAPGARHKYHCFCTNTPCRCRAREARKKASKKLKDKIKKDFGDRFNRLSPEAWTDALPEDLKRANATNDIWIGYHPEPGNIHEEVKKNFKSTIALDAGVNCFLTGYLPDSGATVLICPDAKDKINVLVRKMSSLQSRIDDKVNRDDAIKHSMNEDLPSKRQAIQNAESSIALTRVLKEELFPPVGVYGPENEEIISLFEEIDSDSGKCLHLISKFIGNGEIEDEESLTSADLSGVLDRLRQLNNMKQTLKERTDIFDQASKDYEKMRAEVKSNDPQIVGWQKRIDKLQQQMERLVNHIHNVSTWFLSKFDLVLYPKFGATKEMMSKKKKDPLAKSTKTALSYMAHGRQRAKLLRKMSWTGGDVVNPSEACSTILGSCCGTMASPGTFNGNLRIL